MTNKNYERIYKMDFSSVYPLLLEKIEKKGRIKEELDEIITWLSGYNKNEQKNILKDYISYEDFFSKDPKLNEKRHLISGNICGIKINKIDDELVKGVRYLDKLVDELAKGKTLDKILFKNILSSDPIHNYMLTQDLDKQKILFEIDELFSKALPTTNKKISWSMLTYYEKKI